MKKGIIICMIALSGYALQGCNSSPKDAKETADSLNDVKDTTSNAAVTGGIAVSDDDADFATAAANGGMAEVAMGKLAEEKSTQSQIKEFASTMITDHGKANDELMKIAESKNITLPSSVDADHQQAMDDLRKKSGSEFNKGYVDAMVDGHQKTLDLMKTEAENGKDSDLKAFAAKTAPIVQMHLAKIKKIQDSM